MHISLGLAFFMIIASGIPHLAAAPIVAAQNGPSNIVQNNPRTVQNARALPGRIMCCHPNPETGRMECTIC
ncbi:hypothetical protein WG66_005901 [Moniliophthora roreri]|nr:hypothetical protein WG66_005901 [Moniliophthora roreri]